MGAEFTWVYAGTFGSMRGSRDVQNIASVASAADRPDIPSRSATVEGAGNGTTGDASSMPGFVRAHPVTAASSAAPVDQAPAPTSLAGAAALVGVLLALRFVVPRLLRRKTGQSFRLRSAMRSGTRR